MPTPHRDGYEYRVYSDRDGRPPGWGHGKKTGWGNCGLPPGQAKKYGCQTYTYEGRPHYYYQVELGRIIVRRPSLRFTVAWSFTNTLADPNGRVAHHLSTDL
jgi:hypothetical protein